MGTRVRVEIGNRIVEVQAATREEALKAFKFALRGAFPKLDYLTLKWNVESRAGHRTIILANGSYGNKIQAIENLREVTCFDLKTAKDIVERGSFEAATTEQYAAVKTALTPYVCFLQS